MNDVDELLHRAGEQFRIQVVAPAPVTLPVPSGRSRRAWAAPLAAALAAVALMAGVAVGVSSLTGSASRPPSPAVGSLTAPAPSPGYSEPAASPRSQAPRPLSGSRCPADLPEPTAALPIGVTGVVSKTCGANNALISYGLSGDANAILPSRVNLLISFPQAGQPGWTQLPAPLAIGSTVSISSLKLAPGVVARLTVPKTASGLTRIEWVTAGRYLQLTSDHGYTVKGLTGLALPELVEMARSIR